MRRAALHLAPPEGREESLPLRPSRGARTTARVTVTSGSPPGLRLRPPKSTHWGEHVRELARASSCCCVKMGHRLSDLNARGPQSKELAHTRIHQSPISSKGHSFTWRALLHLPSVGSRFPQETTSSAPPTFAGSFGQLLVVSWDRHRHCGLCEREARCQWGVTGSAVDLPWAAPRDS